MSAYILNTGFFMTKEGSLFNVVFRIGMGSQYLVMTYLIIKTVVYNYSMLKKNKNLPKISFKNSKKTNTQSLQDLKTICIMTLYTQGLRMWKIACVLKGGSYVCTMFARSSFSFSSFSIILASSHLSTFTTFLY